MGSRTFMIGAAVAACLVMSTVFLYPTAQRYYCSVRDHEKLVIEYDVLSIATRSCNRRHFISCKPMQASSSVPTSSSAG